MGNGLRAMNIAILNPDSTKEGEMVRDIANDLTRIPIRLAAIRETHITHGRHYIVDNYRAAASSATKKEKTGVARGGTEVAIRERTKQ